VITGPNVIKLFLSVIFEFLYQARVFVRLGWKTCKGLTLQRITKIRKLQKKKFYIIGLYLINSMSVVVTIGNIFRISVTRTFTS
jgi:hypothetical protein